MPIVTPGLSDEDYKKYFTDDDSERSLSYYDENGNLIGGGSVPQNVSPSSINTVYKNPNGTYSPVAFATDEAKNLYKAWSTSPRVSIENGNIKLTGTKDFLRTDTAEQLRKIFKEMEGQTYNTEALNQQIEAWNTDLQKMSEANSQAILSMNEMNTSIQENVRGTDQNAGMQLYTWEDYQRIANSAAVGRDQNAANSENLIFVGYEWDDKGNRVPKYVKAKDFYTEFNSIDDSKKRQALSDLTVQMNNGDAGAASKLAFLQGGSEGGAANVELGAGQRFLDMASTTSLRFLGKMANAADFITTWTVFGLPRQINRVARGVSDATHGGDFVSGYMKDDAIRSAINDFNDVVDWETAFKMQLTPGSTKIAATLGDTIGTITGMAYSIWGGSIANAVSRSAVNEALSSASSALVKSGRGVTYTSTLGGEGAVVGAGNIQPAKVLDGARVVDQGIYVGDRMVGQVGASVTLPKWLVQTAPNFSQKLAEVGLRSQMAQQVAGITSGLSENGIFTIMRPGSTPVIVTGESLASLKSTMQGLMTARNFAPLVGNSVLRNLDNYFAEKNRGGDPGDLKDYIVTNTVTDIIYGAVMVGAGNTIKGLRDAARASGEPTIKILNAADTYSANSTAGFYSQPEEVFRTEYWEKGFGNTLGLPSGSSVTTVTEAEKLITANGEKFFLPASTLPSAVPASVANEGVGMVGNISKGAIKSFEIAPVGDGFVLTTTTTNTTSGEITTSTNFYPTYEEAAREAQKGATPTVNPSTLMNSDLAATGNIVPFKVGGRSALKYLPNGVSRARIQPNITYLTPSEYATEVTPIVEAMTPELRAAYEKAMAVEDVDSLSQQIYAKDAPAMDAPRLFTPRTEAEAIELAQSVARAQAVAAANPNGSPVMPVQTEPDDVEIVKRRRVVTDRVFYAGQLSEAPTEEVMRRQDAAFVKYIDNSSLSDKMKEQIINNVAKYYTSPKKVDGVELSYLDWTSLELYQMTPSGYTNTARELLDKDEHDYSNVIELRTRSLVGTINKHKQERPRLYRIEGMNGQTYVAGDTVALPLASFSKSTNIFTKSGRYLTTKMYTPGDAYYIIEIDPGKYGSLDISDIAVKPEQQEVLVSDSFTVKSVEEMDTPPGDIKSSKCYKVVLTPTDVDAGVEQVGARLDSPYADKDSVFVDDHGVKVKRVRIGDHDVPIDYEIADRISELNKNGFISYNSHSGIAADHESSGDAGGGYIQFNGAMDKEKLSAIKKAADAAGMNAFEEYNMFYGPVMLVYQHKLKNGQMREDIIRQANLNTAKHYGLPRKSAFVRVTDATPDNKNWLTILGEQGKFNEGLDYRDNEIKRLEEEAGGYALDTDDKRKESWDKFFSELGIEKAPSETTIEVTKKRKTVEVEQRTPRDIVVTEYGLPKKWFSDMDDALDYKNKSDARSIYKVDESATILDRPPVTMDNVYMPTVRGEMGASVAMGAQDFSYTPNTEDSTARFNGLLEAMPELVDSPTDYAQGVLDIASEVQNVYDEIAKATDVNAVYEDYARQIADDVEQPTVSDSVKELFKPLTDMLNKLGLYFDPSGKSLTKDFYLPTGAPSKKLASIEDAILHPEKAIDVDKPVDGSFDDILVDPMRIGDSGFWEKRSGELFRDEDGNFTMAKAGTLQENLTAYVVSALTRGRNRLTIAANNEVARSKYDRNRNQITAEQALKGLRDADKNRTRIRAAQIKNARGYSRKLKDEKIGKLESDYSDKESIDAIEDAYSSTNFAKEIDYTRRANAAAKELGYRQTLTINNIKGSALRFGSNNLPFRGIANDIRKMSHITVTGTKWVKRYGEYVNVGFGLTNAQRGEYGFTRTEPAVNLGDSANLLFSPDRAAAALYQAIQDGVNESVTTGGWTLTNSIKDFARQNFPLISDPEKAAERLVREINKNYSAYDDTKAFNIANLASIETWIKQNAANNINSAIQMADITNLDERTRDAIDQVMTKANVGASVYTSKIVSALQTATYQATLAFNFSPMIGNILSEPERIIDVFGYKVFFKGLTKVANKEELARVKSLLDELPSRFADDREMVGLAEKAKTMVGRAIETYNNIAMSPLQKSEEFKNILFWLCAEENAKLMYPNDPSAQLQNALRMFNDAAIAGGAGTTPGVASSNLGRAAFVLKTFSLRNWDDFIEMAEQIGRSRSGSYKWDRTNRGRDTGGQGGYSSTAGKKKFDYKKAGQFIGGTLLRRYLLWLMVLGPLGRSIWDALGGDPTGLTENFSRGLYDDEGTDEYEGMTLLDNIINAIPTGFIFGTLKDFYFAARRAGVDTGGFFGQVDLAKDPRLQKDLRQHLPLGTVTNRIGDMLELLDRGYSYNSFGNKTYAAPETFGDTLKGFMLGKSTTDSAQAYNKYRYGSVNIWGDIFEGDWLDFAMSANPFAADMGTVKMDTTRIDYNGVFHGSYNDVPTMQAAVADLRERRSAIIREYNDDLEKYTGQFEGLNDSERQAKAAERREKKIDDFTNDVSRLVDAYTEAGNALSDKQINTLMYLFDFNEGDEDTYDSQLARERYVEAGLPDVNPVPQVAEQDSETGEVEEQNYFQRSLVYQNAVQGRYGIPREAAKAVDSALADFKNTYKEYKKRVSDLNDKAYSASKGSTERKRLQSEVEKVQEEYLNQLYAVLTPVVQQYGTEVLSSNDVIESLQPYMSSMVPYSSIKKYGLQYNNGNDIVWGQLSDWVKSRWGASAPTAGSDPEITDGIKQIKALKDQGRTAQAKSQARLLLERIARGSLSARNNDVIELRSLLND